MIFFFFFFSLLLWWWLTMSTDLSLPFDENNLKFLKKKITRNCQKSDVTVNTSLLLTRNYIGHKMHFQNPEILSFHRKPLTFISNALRIILSLNWNERKAIKCLKSHYLRHNVNHFKIRQFSTFTHSAWLSQFIRIHMCCAMFTQKEKLNRML